MPMLTRTSAFLRSACRPGAPPRRARPRALLACALALTTGLHCGEDLTEYTSEEDAKVVEAIEGTWVADGPEGPLTLTLCERDDAPDAGDACGGGHTVRGRGRGQTEEVDLEPDGCGGCEPNVSAFFRGTLQLSDGRRQALLGSVDLNVPRNTSTPYELPYLLDFRREFPNDNENDPVVRLSAKYERAGVFEQASLQWGDGRSGAAGRPGVAGGAGRAGSAGGPVAGSAGQAGQVSGGSGGQGGVSAGQGGDSGGSGEGGSSGGTAGLGGQSGASGGGSGGALAGAGGANEAGAAGEAGAGGEANGAGGEAGEGAGGEAGEGAGGEAGEVNSGGAGGKGGANGNGGVGGQSGSGRAGTGGSLGPPGEPYSGSVIWSGLSFRRVAPADCGAR